ncbi:hypothetical protein HKX48_007465 [Thoreauomyces humboldtii]|nr:hypothetical protein HKX48_007465 [Thoreauomyces humboldtii]
MDPENQRPLDATTGEGTRQLPHRRRRTPLKLVIDTAIKRFKAAVSSNGNGNGNGLTGVLTTIQPPASPSAVPRPPLSASLRDSVRSAASKIGILGPLEAPPAPTPVTLEALHDIVNHVMTDFKRVQLPADRYHITNIVSTAVASNAQLVTMRDRLLGKSWSATDENVCAIFGAVDASNEDYTVPSDSQAFYIRSRLLHMADIVLLRDVFAARFHHELFLSKLDALIITGAERPLNTDHVYLRYIGTVLGPRTPLDRINEDLQVSTLFCKINICLLQMAEDLELTSDPQNGWKVFEFPSLRVATEETENIQLDYVERVMISVFGYESLINVQRGGRYAQYVISDEDKAMFIGLETNVVNKLAALDTAVGVDRATGLPILREADGDVITTSIEQLFGDDIFPYIREHPFLVANRPVEPTSRIVIDTVRQAVPRTDYMDPGEHIGTLVVLIGKDVPLESYDPSLSDARFITEASRSGHLTKLILDQLAGFEAIANGSQAELVHGTFVDLLPFVDLYPWLLCFAHALGISYMNLYLCITRPWITVTFSKKVATTLLSGFGFYGTFDGSVQAGSATLLDIVGIPVLTTFDADWLEDEEATDPPDDVYTVTIPHYDSGRDKYGEQAPELRRVLVLTWMATFVLMDEAHRILTEATVGDSNLSRRTLCINIRDATVARLNDSGFNAVFASARAELSEYFGRNKPLCARGSWIWRTARTSEQSLEEADTSTWSAPSYNGDPLVKEAWINWIVTRREEVNLVTAAIGRRVFDETVAHRNRQPNTLNILTDSLDLDNDDINDEDTAVQNIQDRLEQMRLGRSRSERFQQAQQTRAMVRWNLDPEEIHRNAQANLQGQAVAVHQQMALFYAAIDDKVESFQIRLPKTILTKASTSTLDFRADGIHLVAQDGTDVGASANVLNMPFYRKQGHTLQRVWQRQYNAKIGPGAPNQATIPATPVGYGPPKWAGASKTQKYLKVAPIAQADAIWLFQQWLDDKFPEPNNQIRHHWLDSANPFLRFADWIDTNYPNHGHCATWKQLIVDANEDSTKHFRGSVMALRGELDTTSQYAVPRPGRGTGKIWKFGGPRPDGALLKRN